MTSETHKAGPIEYVYQARSDVGRVRTNNEDSLLDVPEIGLFGVCDGLGGHAAGEVASSMAVATLEELVKDASDTPGEILKQAILEANKRILQDQAEHPDRRGMGTTVSLMWFVPGDSKVAWIGHVGDSRIYLQQNNELNQLTEDHSPVFRLYKQGVLTKEQMQRHPQKNLLERSLGVVPFVNVDVFTVTPGPGDRFLICTDGLTDHVQDEVIHSILMDSPCDEAVDQLVANANENGGTDNITLVLLNIVQIEDQ